MRFEAAAIVLLLCVTGAACSSSVGGRPHLSAAGLSRAPEPSTTCPFGVRGARVRMSDTDDGVVIALRGFGDVEEIRRRARDAAAAWGPGAHRGLGHDGRHGGGHQHGLGLAQLGVPVQAEAEDTAEGARITVRPKAASDLETMRAALWRREEHARAGQCP